MPQKTERILCITVCAWCGSEKSQRYIPRPDGYKKDAMISHGICDRCRNRVLAKIRNIPIQIGSEHEIHKGVCDSQAASK